MAQVPDVQLSLRPLRERASRSQSEIAAALGVTASHISKLEAGKTGVTLDLAAAYVRELGCRLVVEGEPAPPSTSLTAERSEVLQDLRRVLPYVPLLLVMELGLIVRSWTARYVP